MSSAPKAVQKKPSVDKDGGLNPNKVIEDEGLSEVQLKALHEKLGALRAADAMAEPDNKKQRRSFRALIAWAACDFGVNDIMIMDLVKLHFGVADISELHEGHRAALNRFLENQDGHLVLYTNLMQSVISGQGGGVVAITQNQNEFFEIFCNNHEWLRRVDEFASIRCLTTAGDIEASKYTRLAFRSAVTDQDRQLPGCLIFDRKFVMIRKVGREYHFTIIGDAKMAHYHKALFDAAWKKTAAA